MIVEKIVVGPLEANAYIIGDDITGNAIVIDPGDEPDRILDAITRRGLKLNAIICTHAHFDHIGAAGDLKKETGVKLLLHKHDLEAYGLARDQAAFWGYSVDDLPQPDQFVDEGDEIHVGNLRFSIMHTPGHSRGGICLYGEGILVTGDTIFAGSIGRTDFPGGSMEELKKSFKRIMALPEDTKIYSGHGLETTIKRERTENFFIHEL